MADEIRQITGLPDGLRPVKPQKTEIPSDRPSFGRVLNSLVKEVDHLQKNAEKATGKMLSGEVEDIHQVVVAMQEAQTSFRLLMEIRNKMVDAYREVMKMQV